MAEETNTIPELKIYHVDTPPNRPDNVIEQVTRQRKVGGREMTIGNALRGCKRAVTSVHKGRLFWPPSVLNDIITDRTIRAELLRTKLSSKNETDMTELIGKILTECIRLFAALCLISRAGDIEEFMEEGIRDEQLPLRCDATYSDQLQYRTQGTWKDCRTSEDWAPHERESFIETHQHKVNPVFLKRTESMEPRHLEPDEILPIIKKTKFGSGSNATVSKVEIQSDCHAFRDVLKLIKTGDTYALKEPIKFEKSLQAEVDRELKSLSRFNGFSHPNLVTLLCTWTQEENRQPSLLFPCADWNLDLYMSDHPDPIDPENDQGTIRWMSEQIRDLTSALVCIHKPAGASSSTELSPKAGDELYGRHGDIKPDNILHYASSSNSKGAWILADLGYTALHHLWSRSKVANGSVICAPTYRAPEKELKGGLISRAYDIWTWGCVLLELIIWALDGDGERETFFINLNKPYISGLSRNMLFDIQRKVERKEDETEFVVLVKPEVNQRVNELHKSPRCTNYIHDLLDAIEDEMIICISENKNRIKAKDLKKRLHTMHSKVLDEASDYASKPRPHSHREPRSHAPVDAVFDEKKEERLQAQGEKLKVNREKSLRSKSIGELE